MIYLIQDDITPLLTANAATILTESVIPNASSPWFEHN
jgi:hypothetical protein